MAPLDIVVVATDFSPSADLALSRVGSLPLSTVARVDLVHVFSQAGELPPKLRAQAEAEARMELSAAAQKLRDELDHRDRRTVEVTQALAFGPQTPEIIRQADSVNADLLVVGRHGHRGVRDLFIGSTAAHVLRASGRPTLVVNGAAGGPYARPLVAVDLESDAKPVLDIAQRIAPDVPLSLIHAHQIPFEGFLRAAGLEREYRERQRHEAKARMDALAASMAGTTLRPILRAGDPRTAVLFEAELLGADLLALGTHARSGLSHAVLGSVAEWVVQAAKCDVLIARN